MKNKRHDKILELIKNNDVDTQEELLRLLKESRYNVTQATVSRDIKELRLIKVQTDMGKYRYEYKEIDKENISLGFFGLFSSSVIKVEAAQNLVVIKSIGGMAQAICAGIDSMHFESLVGTLAGDDTIFIVMRDNENAKSVENKFQKLMFGR